MLNEYGKKVYMVTGRTDLRMGIDGLGKIVQRRFMESPYSGTLFLFCGRQNDRIKGLLYDGNGFLLLYKRLDIGRFNWPMNSEEASKITAQEYRYLTDQLSIQKRQKSSRGSSANKSQSSRVNQ